MHSHCLHVRPFSQSCHWSLNADREGMNIQESLKSKLGICDCSWGCMESLCLLLFSGGRNRVFKGEGWLLAGAYIELILGIFTGLGFSKTPPIRK